jgi:transposase-like protein
MPAPRKFDEATRERAVRMYRDRLEQHGESKVEARRQVGALLDLNQATIRNWVEAIERAEDRAAGSLPAASTRAAESEEVRALKRRGAELERANDILKTASAFFAQAELDRRLK